MIQFNLPRATPSFVELADEIGDYVQHLGGEFFCRKHHVEFHVPIKCIDFMLIRYPVLQMESYVW